MPCSALVAPFWRAPGERHGAPEPRPHDPRGNSWHRRQHREPARGRIRPAGHDGLNLPGPYGASHQHAGGLRSHGCSCAAPSLRDPFCARRRQPAALRAQGWREAVFLAQHALCMPTPRAHSPVGCLGPGDHVCPLFCACPPSADFGSSSDLLRTDHTGGLCPAYSRTNHTV